MRRLALLAMLAACSSHAAPDPTAPDQARPPKDAITKTTENGPVKVDVRVWPAKPTLDDPIYLRLDITAPPGVRVDAPFQEAGDERMGRFRVLGFTRNHDAGHQAETYTLEAPSSGKQRIPPLRLEMTDRRDLKAKEAPRPEELLTDEIPLDVAPVNAATSGAQMRPAAGTLDPDVGGLPWTTILLVVSAAMVAASAAVLGLRAWHAGRRRARQRSAYDDAIAKLQSLEARGAPGSDQADAWFVELSAIVRTYLERRYEIRAPELTTEEFLQEASRGSRLSAEHRKLLSSFLERCDRVKFAGYRPDAQESIDSLAAARAFVEDTRVREAEAAAA